jgi:hypothetical protein
VLSPGRICAEPPSPRRRGCAYVGACTALSVLGHPRRLRHPAGSAAYADTTTDTYIVQLKAGVSADKVTVSKLMGTSAKVVHKVFQGGIAKLNAAQARRCPRTPT